MSQKKLAFIFPGQGAQYSGMGKDFFEQYRVCKDTFEEADEILKRRLSKIIFEGPESELTETRNSQVGIYVTSIALLRVLQEQFPNMKPQVCAGLSLGEYTAVTASGRLSFAECLPLVQCRGEFMNEACEKNRGAMSVVMGLDAEAVEELVASLNLPEDLWIANLNCPGQVVISGTLKGIEKGSEAAKMRGAKRIIPLQVHGAFHSGLMREAEKKLQPHVMSARFSCTDVMLAMNVTGDFVKEISETRELLIKQVTSPVRWEKCIRAIDRSQVELFVEIGCGKTLTGMNKRIGVRADTTNIENIADLETFAKLF